MPSFRLKVPWQSIAEWLVLQGSEKIGFLTPKEREDVDKMLFGMSVATSAVATRAAYSVLAHVHNVAISRGVSQPYSSVFVDAPLKPTRLKLSGLTKPGRPPPGAGLLTIAMIAPTMIMTAHDAMGWWSTRDDPVGHRQGLV